MKKQHFKKLGKLIKNEEYLFAICPQLKNIEITDGEIEADNSGKISIINGKFCNGVLHEIDIDGGKFENIGFSNCRFSSHYFSEKIRCYFIYKNCLTN